MAGEKMGYGTGGFLLGMLTKWGIDQLTGRPPAEVEDVISKLKITTEAQGGTYAMEPRFLMSYKYAFDGRAAYLYAFLTRGVDVDALVTVAPTEEGGSVEVARMTCNGVTVRFNGETEVEFPPVKFQPQALPGYYGFTYTAK